MQKSSTLEQALPPARTRKGHYWRHRVHSKRRHRLGASCDRTAHCPGVEAVLPIVDVGRQRGGAGAGGVAWGGTAVAHRLEPALVALGSSSSLPLGVQGGEVEGRAALGLQGEGAAVALQAGGRRGGRRWAR